MADGQDYTQDPAFLNAPPEQQHGYLAATNPSYAKAPPEIQKAYIDHVNGGTHGERTAALTPPTAPKPSMNKVEPLTGGQVTPEEEQSIENRGASARNNMITPVTNAASVIMPTAGAAEMGAGRAARTVGGSLVGGAVGAPVGSAGARRLVGAFGASPQTQDTAGTVGAVAGGLLGAAGGGYEGYKGLPEETTIAGTKFNTPSWLRKSPFEPSEGYSNPLGPDKGEFEAQHEAQLQDQGKLAKLPNRVKPPFEQKPPLPQRAYAEMNQDITKGRQERAAARDTAHEDLAQARMRRGREQERIDEGAPVEGSSQRVTKVPEPNPVPPGENPNNQQSVPRRTTLVQNAKRGKEGAGLQLNQIHGPVLYEPKGTGYSGVREQVPLGGDTPIRGGSGKGLTNPESVLGEQFPALERRTAPRVSAASSAPPDPIREARLGELRKAVRDPSLSDRDRSIVQSQLDDMESHPGERNTLGDNPSQLKKPQPTMSREEAEAASKKREEGRNARFRK